MPCLLASTKICPTVCHLQMICDLVRWILKNLLLVRKPRDLHLYRCFRLAILTPLIEEFPGRYRIMIEKGGRLFHKIVLVAGTFLVLATHPDVISNRRLFSAKVFIYGSAQYPAEPFLRRCGYAVVQLSDHVDWESTRKLAISHASCVVYGPLRRHVHTVPEPETMACIAQCGTSFADWL